MRISGLGLILMFLFPITLFAQQRVDVTGKTLVVSNNGEGQEVLPYTNILVLEARGFHPCKRGESVPAGISALASMQRKNRLTC